MSKQQTAVEWLEDNLIGNPFSEKDFSHNVNLFKQAKEMEKEQIIKAADHIMIYDNKGNYPTLGEIYYKENYES